MASNPNPFASDSSGLSRMLQAAFAAMPQGGGQLNKTPIPSFEQPQSQMIDLGAGGPAPGTQRGNFLTGLGDFAQGASSMIGSAMAANQAANVAKGQDALKSVGLMDAAGKMKPVALPAPQIATSIDPSYFAKKGW